MGRKVASEPLTSEDTGLLNVSANGVCMCMSLSTAAISALQTGKSSTLKQALDWYFNSMNQTENNQLIELLARPIFS